MNFRDKKGSITIFVLVALLFMSAFLLISYANNINKSKIAKEQFNIVSDIYSYKDSDAEAYNRAYTALRKKNKQILTETVENTATLELNKTYEAKLDNYKIYGNTTSVGTLVTSTADSNYGKYQIQVKVTSSDSRSAITNIYISSPLKQSGTLVDYIDYKNQKVVRQVDSQTEETVSLPDISMYEDYSKIEIITNYNPSKIEVDYVGYTFE